MLDAGTVYFWRVTPENSCGVVDINRVSSFQTKALSCEEYCSTDPSVFIPAATPFDAELAINIGASQSPDEINVTEIKGNHQQISDVNFYIEGPDGTRVLLEKSGYCPVGTNMDFGFDDDAVGVFPDCSNPSATYNSGTLFQPEEPLSNLNGIPGSIYTLIMNDVNAGFGGRLDSWCFEICGAAVIEAATLINADSLHVPILGSRVVGSDKLEVSHTAYSAAELTITILSVPNFGSMLIDGVPVSSGAQLTMQDVIDNKLAYQHENMSAALDQFTFIVTDPGGGFLGTPSIRFYVGGSSSKDQLPQGSYLTLFPNPVESTLTVDFNGKQTLDEITIYDFQGRLISNLPGLKTDNIEINLENISSGIYFLEAKINEYQVIRKFIKRIIRFNWAIEQNLSPNFRFHKPPILFNLLPTETTK